MRFYSYIVVFLHVYHYKITIPNLRGNHIKSQHQTSRTLQLRKAHVMEHPNFQCGQACPNEEWGSSKDRNIQSNSVWEGLRGKLSQVALCMERSWKDVFLYRPLAISRGGLGGHYIEKSSIKCDVHVFRWSIKWLALTSKKMSQRAPVHTASFPSAGVPIEPAAPTPKAYNPRLRIRMGDKRCWHQAQPPCTFSVPLIGRLKGTQGNLRDWKGK